MRVLLATTLILMIAMTFGKQSWAGAAANPHQWAHDPPILDQRMQALQSGVTVFPGRGNGSGTAVARGVLGTYIVTNHHVVREREGIEVRFYGSDENHRAYIHSVDVENDIAVLITRAEAPAIATVGRRPRMFEEAVCIGSPAGTDLAPSVGIITELDHAVRDDESGRLFHRSDCNIVGGSSGGGLFVERRGEWHLVGMPTQVYVIRSGLSGAQVPFLGMMVRSEEIRHHLEVNNVPMRS